MTTTTRPTTYGSAIVWSIAGTLLLIPAIAMRFTAEVNWTASDFVVMGLLLASVAGAYEFLARKAPNWTYRAAAAVALLAALLLVGVNLAIGIIGSENNDANMMYAGVLAVAVGGACLARCRSEGMARAMAATAAAQALVGVIALATGAGAEGAAWPKDVIGATAILSTMWLASAWLFRRAA
jgi:hypothetical protein